MREDCLGNPVTAERGATLSAINAFIEGYLAYETRAEAIVTAADADPACCLANVYAGFLWMFLEAPAAASRADRYLAAAQRAAPMATQREQLNTQLLAAWAADDGAESLRVCEVLGEKFPRDLVAVKTHQYFEFNRGNAPHMLRAALRVLGSNAGNAHMHGMLAFAYEQCHLLVEAEQAARAALALRRKEPWAQHALAHVMLTRGRIDEGAKFLEGMRDTWVDLNSFMITHLCWHLALFYLSQGRDAEALEVYDRDCWGVAKHYSQDQIGAVSLLARLEASGIGVGDRWRDLGDHLSSRTHDTVLPFLSMQYVYGLARAGRAEAQELLQSVRQRAVQGSGEVWRDVALPACEGLYAHARGDFDSAWRHLGIAMPRMLEVGGSHAQRDLFELLLADAAIKSGRWVAAQQMLESRREADPRGVPVNVALSGVYAKLGLSALAEQCAQRAASTRARHRTHERIRAS